MCELGSTALCVRVRCSAAEAKDFASHMFGRKLVTKQTGPEGQLCSRVLINASLEIEKEYYFAVLMDRSCNGPVIVASTQGGMDIEEVAEKNPAAVLKVRGMLCFVRMLLPHTICIAGAG